MQNGGIEGANPRVRPLSFALSVRRGAAFQDAKRCGYARFRTFGGDAFAVTGRIEVRPSNEAPARLRAFIVSAVAALASMVAACEDPKDKAPPPVTSTAPHVPCGEAEIISPGATHCGIGLTLNSALTLDGLPLLGGSPFRLGEDMESGADSLMVYPSPGGRFFFVRGCEGPSLEPRRCPRAAILDRHGGRLHPVAFRADGPTAFILWSPDERRFALVEPLPEGFHALFIINPETGEAAAYPPAQAAERFRIDEALLRWASPRDVEAQLQVCARACAAETRRFASP